MIKMEISHKKLVLPEHKKTMSKIDNGELLYKINTVIHAFIYYAASRVTYEKPREDYQPPSQSTLTCLTLKLENIVDKKFLSETSSHLLKHHRNVIVLIDEVYVNAYLSFHGVRVFGTA